MSFDDIILDLKCVSLGIPPLSGPSSDVAEVIMSLPPKDRRRVSRKIKKLCKKYISAECLFGNRPGLRRHLEARLGFKRDKQLFNKGALMKRVAFVRSHIVDEENQKEFS